MNQYRIIEKDNKEYWDNFYSKQRLSKPSTFFEFIKEYNFSVDEVVDVGCGNGRDAQAFRLADYSVLGIDRSESAIINNTGNAVDKNEKYMQVDISKVEELTTAFKLVKGKLLVYSRFFLHSIDEESQTILLDFLSQTMKKEDVLALEFRTKEDEIIDKVFGNHYRRYIDSDMLVKELAYRYDFEIEYHYKGQGLSIFKEEDPYLARIIAVKK